jgi:Zn-dependent peptidase ImmA (M78 family)
MPNNVASRNVENLYERIFFSIKNGVDRLLPYDEDTCYSENPFVDIEAIAIDAGIKEIRRVPPTYIHKGKTIIVEYSLLIKENGEYIILVNKNKSKEEQRFSIAHEIEHYISLQVDKHNIPWDDYFPSFLIAHEIAHSFTKTKKRPKSEYLPREVVIAARSDYFSRSKDFEVQQLRPNKVILRKAAEIIDGYVSFVLRKHISGKKIDVIFQQHFKPLLKKNANPIIRRAMRHDYIKTELKNALYDAIVETTEEEIADYFAANLLVPTEMFVLWEDKSDKEIARAFGVPIKCIAKRRKFEINYELESLTPKNISSGVKIEETTPLTHDKLNHILGGSDINASERV